MVDDTKTVIKNIENLRAQFAYQAVCQANKQLDDGAEHYKSYVKKMPMLIKTNGLGNTLAYIFANCSNDSYKSNDAYKLIYDQIAQWLTEKNEYMFRFAENEELVYQIASLPSSQYRAVTLEVLALFAWLRRFAEGMIDNKGVKKDEETGHY